jgi:AraC family transcriptional regulator
VEVIRRTLFESATLQIDFVDTRPVSDACGEIEQQSLNVVVLPVSGVFSKHDGPGRHVVGTPSHAIFVAAETPYRLGFPGAIGDRALALRFDDTLAPDRLDRQRGIETLASHGLLPANAMMLRNLLRARLGNGEADRFETESLGLDLLHMSLRSMRTGNTSVRRSTLARWSRALERVKEAVALAPADKWDVAKLAKVAHLSPFHLCHVFRQMVGTSIYDYVLHERLAHTLDGVLDRGGDLTSIALDAGFASHSHFTARFSEFLRSYPDRAKAHRNSGTRRRIPKIMTARRS